MNITGETKFFIGIIIATVVIILGAVFFFGGSSKNTPATSGVKVNTDILIRSDSYKVATDSASVTLVEFADYQCPACGSYHPLLKQLLSEFAGKLDFVYRNYPLQQHPNARIAAQAAEAAGSQGKFWQMHDAIFENQIKWSDANNAKDIFTGYAKTIGLDMDRFNKDIDSDSIKEKIDRDTADGNTLGVNSTPTFYLDAEKLENPASLDDFRTLVKAAILKSPITQSPAAKYHAHADFKVYIDGKAIDFSVAKYQSVEGKELNSDVHLHDNKGNLIHLHKQGIKLGEFFKSLQMQLTGTCLVVDTGEKYCSSGNSTLKMFVNGKPNTKFSEYVPEDLDRILITYGADSEQNIQTQINSVTDMACIYSLKCPQRGKPPTENCVGGLGSGCSD